MKRWLVACVLAAFLLVACDNSDGAVARNGTVREMEARLSALIIQECGL